MLYMYTLSYTKFTHTGHFLACEVHDEMSVKVSNWESLSISAKDGAVSLFFALRLIRA